ncbi:MAG TPA: hypothetical protein HA346_03315 [Thermoplasmata archaeon]|nr:hypothetical protein [Thermoplasmata archaeon]
MNKIDWLRLMSIRTDLPTQVLQKASAKTKIRYLAKPKIKRYKQYPEVSP